MRSQEKLQSDYSENQSLLAFAQEKKASALPEHLIRLSDSEWRAWRCVALRGAGFPVSDVMKLSSSECAEAADNLTKYERENESARQKAIDDLRGELDALRVERPEDEATRRSLLNKALRNLKKGKLPKAISLSEKTEHAISRMGEASARFEAARKEFHRAFEAASAHISKQLVAVASSDRFREAVLWQNRRAVRSGLDALLREAAKSERRGTKQRQHEELVASYLQRYCVKNDTIGFFGPVGWASFVEDEEGIVSHPGADFVEERNVYFEGWGIDVVADMLAKNKRLLPWGVPRLMPFAHLDRVTIYVPFQQPTRIPVQQAAVLISCDGERTAKEIAESLLQIPSLGFKSEEEVYLLLETFKNRGLIAWTIEVPLMLNPDRRLRQMMEKIDDESLRQPIIRSLDELEAARVAVARAAGDSESLDRALSLLDETFMRLTKSAPTRPGSEGKAYSSRTLVYEDCRRGAEIKLGTEFAESLGEPLSFLLTSARWLTYEASETFREFFGQLYDGLAQKAGTPVVEAVNFWYRMVPLLFENSGGVVDSILPVFQQRWSEILALPEDGNRRLHYSCETLRPLVQAAFDVPAPGWVAARYHSPDVMIAAADTEAIGRGDYQLVLGEMHVGINTIRSTMFIAQHKSPQDFARFFDSDFPERRLVLIGPKSWPELTARTLPIMVNSRDWMLMGTQDSFGAPKSQALNIGSMVIERTAEGLVARTRDRRLCVDLIEGFADVLSTLMVNSFKILPPRAHSPRITIDRLVVSRETWRFTPEEVGFAYEPSETERFVQARRWMQAKGMPRFVFYKSPVERKPCYVDFESPIYVEMFARAIRRTKENDAANPTITVSEMLPRPDQTWLRDAEGNVYTSELRIIGVDDVGRQRRA